ncbi:MAG: hypothetical protein HY240_07275 [Actinobacteria bacterium]|nr:hypothetical protein [Actinomycetota bacterium]
MTEHADLGDLSPFAAVYGREGVANLVSEGPVRFLLVSGRHDDDAWGVIGAFWLSIDGARGGFVVNPQALWQGSEMARNYHSARRRGWTPEEVYRFWQDRVGASDAVMIDPQQHADTLLHVYRRAGAL